MIYFTLCKQVLKFTNLFTSNVNPFYLLSLSLAFKEGKDHVLCDILSQED